MSTELKADRAGHDIVSWRRRRLLAAGFNLALATSVGHDVRYDLHALIELRERGCPPELAVRIVAPLEELAA